jgi:hypothetical protein
MARKVSKRLEFIHRDCAGIGVGASRHYVAVDLGCCEEPVRSFGCFTDELEAMGRWLGQYGVSIVAMESTGVYWIPIYDVLDRVGFEVHWVTPWATKQQGARANETSRQSSTSISSGTITGHTNMRKSVRGSPNSPRFHVHLTPTYASWINQVERWFALFSEQAIRRSSTKTVDDLIGKIERYIAEPNRRATPLNWTATADSILAKVQQLSKLVFDKSH